MKPLISTTLLLSMVLAAASPLKAHADDRGPVCREPSVVDEITREVIARNYYASVDPDLVTEQWTPDPLVVRCQVCVQSAPYNDLRIGDRIVPLCRPHDFEIQIHPRGFVVRDLQ